MKRPSSRDAGERVPISQKRGLDDVPSQTTLPGIRLEAEAAMLEARGNRAAARQTLARLEALLRERPAAPARDMSLRLLRRWQADLEREC